MCPGLDARIDNFENAKYAIKKFLDDRNHMKEEHQRQDSTNGGDFGHGQFDSNGQEILHFDNLERFLVK